MDRDYYIGIFSKAKTEGEIELLMRLDNVINIDNKKFGLTIKNMKYGFSEGGRFSTSNEIGKIWNKVIAKLEKEKQFQEIQS